MGADHRLHAPAASPPRKELRGQLNTGLGASRSRSLTVMGKKPDFELRIVQSVAKSLFQYCSKYYYAFQGGRAVSVMALLR